MNTFQTVILIIFIAFIVLGVLLFSGVLPGVGNDLESGVSGEVTIWGVAENQPMQSVVNELNSEFGNDLRLVYVEKAPATYERELVEALAAGAGPDIFMLPHTLIVRHSDKVLPISYEQIPRREFQDAFIEEGELFLRRGGILALPVAVDPVVMYWSRTLFGAAGIAEPPRYWDEFLTLVPRLTKRDEAANILQSAAALGEFRNITHAKDLLSALILQTNDTLVSHEEGENLARYNVSLGDGAASALRFYTEFANPANALYTWNRSLPSSQDLFIAEELAVYFGRVSDIQTLRTKNPHLNFDVALLPQIRDRNIRATYGALMGLSVSKQSDNPVAALYVAEVLSGATEGERIAQALKYAPVRRSVLSSPPEEDPYKSVFYESAVASAGWYDPEPASTYEIFRGMIENISSGRLRVTESVSAAHRQIEDLLK